MKPRKILVLNGHPADTSLSQLFARAYAETARAAGHEVKMEELRAMTLDPDFEYGGHSRTKPLEPDLERFMEALEWSDHFVLTTPMWWGGLPSLLKGLFDRAFLPGRTFDTRNPTMIGLPKPMLKGRSGRVIMTSDTPRWFFSLRYQSSLIWQLKGQILNFVGISPVRVSYFSAASHPKPGRVEGWLNKVRKLATKGQ